MDKFPDSFNRATCYDIMEQCQTELLKTTRNTIYENIQTSVRDCSQLITLEFPDKLWNEHRITLIRELLERFGKIRVEDPNKGAPRIKQLNITEAIPDNVKRVTIDLIKDT